MEPTIIKVNNPCPGIQYGGSIVFPRKGYRVRERVRFLKMPDEAAARTSPSFVEMTKNRDLEEFFLDFNLLRTHARKHTTYRDPVSINVGTEKEARRAVDDMQKFIYGRVNALGLAFPMNSILNDKEISTEAKAACYVFLWRSQYADINDGNFCLAKANSFLLKFYLLTRFFPEAIEGEKITIRSLFPDAFYSLKHESFAYDFSEAIPILLNPFGQARMEYRVEFTFADNMILFYKEGDAYMPAVSHKFPFEFHERLVDHLNWKLRNLVFV